MRKRFRKLEMSDKSKLFTIIAVIVYIVFTTLMCIGFSCEITALGIVSMIIASVAFIYIAIQIMAHLG